MQGEYDDINLLFSLKKEIKFFLGVPIVYWGNQRIFEKMSDKDHIVEVNEGVATLCVGNHLATGNLPCVYLQIRLETLSTHLFQ